MANVGKTILWTLIGGAAAYAIYKAAQTANEAKSFTDQVGINVNVGSVKFSGMNLVVSVGIQLSNPTNFTLNDLQKPDVILRYNGVELARSLNTTGQTISIPKHGVTEIFYFPFTIPIASNISVFLDMARQIGSNIMVSPEDNIIQKGLAIVSAFSDNLQQKLLPLIDLAVLLNVGGNTITYNSKLV